jgi:hypothetical protein
VESNTGVSVLSQLTGCNLPAFIERALERLLCVRELFGMYRSIAQRQSPLVTELLRELRIATFVAPFDLEQIPRRGGVVVTPNHPHGLLHGAVLVHTVRSVRADVKLLANDVLRTIPELRDLVIPIDV